MYVCVGAGKRNSSWPQGHLIKQHGYKKGHTAGLQVWEMDDIWNVAFKKSTCTSMSMNDRYEWNMLRYFFLDLKIIKKESLLIFIWKITIVARSCLSASIFLKLHVTAERELNIINSVFWFVRRSEGSWCQSTELRLKDLLHLGPADSDTVTS